VERVTEDENFPGKFGEDFPRKCDNIENKVVFGKNLPHLI